MPTTSTFDACKLLTSNKKQKDKKKNQKTKIKTLYLISMN